MRMARTRPNSWPFMGHLGEASKVNESASGQSNLVEFQFSPNPGALLAKKYVPKDLAPGAPLVVVLHGCTQTPEGYERGTGWTQLASRHGFAVLYPEQQRANNMNNCFNWFEPGDMRRGGGEPASIRSMIDHMVTDHAIDPARIYITGLSAGGAMAGVMLATYPEIFAGGGLIAGLPYGLAKSMPAALTRMRGRGRESGLQLADLVRKASDHSGPWPKISVWHGSADATVHASNADATVEQWRAVHGLADVAAVTDSVDGYPHRVWRDADDNVLVEEYEITGMGHGTPLDAGEVDSCEQSGAYLLNVGISSTRRIAAFWGLMEPHIGGPVGKPALHDEDLSVPQPAVNERLLSLPAPHGVQEIIENALRSTGLMR